MECLTKVQLQSIPGTMQIHQIITTGPDNLYHRQVSCSCEKRTDLCQCYGMKKGKLLSQPASVPGDAVLLPNSGIGSDADQQRLKVKSRLPSDSLKKQKEEM